MVEWETSPLPPMQVVQESNMLMHDARGWIPSRRFGWKSEIVIRGFVFLSVLHAVVS